MTHPNERDCEHGQHRKSCNICEYERDIAERDQRIAQLEQQADVDRSFIEQYQRQVAELEQQLAMAHRMIECREANELNLEKQLVDARRDAERYKFLRARDLDTIDIGGIFVGVVPDNLVINENDLDAAVDAAIAERQESGHG